MSVDQICAAIILIVTALVLWIGWPRRGLLCDRCRWRPVEQHLGDDWLCAHCIAEQIDGPAPRSGGAQ